MIKEDSLHLFVIIIIISTEGGMRIPATLSESLTFSEGQGHFDGFITLTSW